MSTAIGVVMTEHIVTGKLVDQKVTGKTLLYPTDLTTQEELASMPASELVETIAGHIEALTQGSAGEGKGLPEAIGVSVPGIVRSGVVEESPNLPQIKGMPLRSEERRVGKECV